MAGTPDAAEREVQRAIDRVLGPKSDARALACSTVHRPPIVEADPWRRGVREFMRDHPGAAIGFMPPERLTRLGNARTRLLSVLAQRLAPETGLHAQRAAEKQAARDADAADIHAGRRTAEQVNRDNTLVHGLMDRFRPNPKHGVR